MLSIVLFVLETISKMCGIETSPIPEIVHDLGLSDTGHPQIPWFFIILAIFGDTPFFLGDTLFPNTLKYYMVVKISHDVPRKSPFTNDFPHLFRIHLPFTAIDS